MKGRVWHLLSGARSVFHIGDSELEVTYGGLTGLETVTLNGEVIARRRSFSLESAHDIVINGRNHYITISTKGDAIATVTVSIDGVEVQKQMLIIPLLKAVNDEKAFSESRFMRWGLIGLACLIGFPTYVFLKLEFAFFGLFALAIGFLVGGIVFALMLLPSEYRIVVQDGSLAPNNDDQHDSR